MAQIENNSQNRGMGKWKFFTYNPAISIGIFEGNLFISKDFHSVFKDNANCIFNIPSQNVAFVINLNMIKDYKIENLD
jgi:hypothetical protein